MMIIFEGPDGSGKSTIIDTFLSLVPNNPHIKTIVSEGPEKYPEEILERIDRYHTNYMSAQDDLWIYDRHPAISQNIYAQFNNKTRVDQARINRLYECRPLNVYCRGRDQLGDHVAKEHDSEDHLKMVKERHSAIRNDYDSWALEHAHFVYRMHEKPGAIVRFLRSLLNV